MSKYESMNEAYDHYEIEFDSGVYVSCGFDYDKTLQSEAEFCERGYLKRAAEYNYEINLYDVEGMDEEGDDVVVTSTMQKTIKQKIESKLIDLE